MVSDESSGPRLTCWFPTVVLRTNQAGEPFLTVVSQPWLSVRIPEVTTHCFEHGRGHAERSLVETAIAEYRKIGRTVRIRIAPRSEGEHR